MATTPIEVYYDPGKTLTVSVYPRNSDTASFTGRSLTEESNRTGVYTCNVTEALDGKYTVHLFEGSRKRGIFDIDLDDDANTHYCTQVGTNVVASFYDSLVFILASVANNVTSTLADTNELQADWQNGGRLDLLIDAIKAKTDQLAFGTANRVNAQVYGMQNDVITAAAHDESTAYPLKSADSGSTQVARVGADGDTLETISDQIDGLNDLSAAEVNAEVDTALSDYDAPTATEMTAAFTEIKGATWSTTDTLEAIRDRGDSAWITATGFSTHDAADVRTEMDANSTKLAAIVADTNELQTNQGDWATADVSGLATASALATVDNNVDSILTDTGTTLPAQISGLNDFDPANDTVAHVTLVDTTTTNTDMRGTDSAFLAANAPTNFSDLAIASTTGLVSVGTNNDKTGYSISGTKNTLDDLNDVSTAQVNAEVDTALGDYDGPTKTEMDAAFTEIKGATWSSSTDTLEAIRNRGDAAWTTATSSTVVTALGLYGAALQSTLSDVYDFTDATLTVVNNLNDISASDVLTQATSALNTYDPPTKTEMDSAFTEIKGATWNSSTDTLEEIRDNVGGGGGGGDATEAKQDTIIAAIGALNDISAADVIDYDMGNGRTVAEALAPLRNKWTIASGVYTVYDTDDTTVLWTASSVQTAGDPTSSIDPV